MILLYALSRSLAPSTLATSTNTSSLFDPVTSECIDINGCRTTTGILWSCLSVILICTWVAIHPDIPRVGTHSALVVYKNIQLMVIAILAPEIIILWAMRQWYSARAIAEKYKDYGWGMSHAFFVIMGGFALYEGDTFHGYLWNDGDVIYSEDGKRQYSPTEREEYVEKIKTHIQKVQDCSPQKNTPKFNVVVSHPLDVLPSTSHPVLIQDAIQPQESYNPTFGTPEPSYLLEYFLQKGYITITEDEIKDKSHADFIAKSIALIQTTWFILQVAARAAEHLAITELEIITVGFALLNFGTYVFWWNKPLRVQYPVRVTWQQQELPISQSSKSEGSCMEAVQKGMAAIWGYIFEGESRPNNLPLAVQLISLPLWMAWNIILQCIDLFDDKPVTDEFPTRLEEDPLRLYITVYSIAAAFGAIHCIPWSFQFATHTEQLLWRICAVAVAAAPIAMGCVHWWQKELRHSTSEWLEVLIVMTAILLSIFYVFSRVTLIILALMALRDLSPSAYQTVQWTTFVPHIG
ncbi:hypothetical protein Moror_5907 [Moniliophthora roreri MCA 2997]|uniref:Integral membrane protein n=1 Tax=Moniliophthora roreri (strain MCA 2997) TaxID=1381753 RepID=V2WEX4_MONRO|nr:hypothetical protein Moror_5907 [Moniliophthora roreri MCA 2997]